MATNSNNSASDKSVSDFNLLFLAFFIALPLTSTTPRDGAPLPTDGTPEASSSRANEANEASSASVDTTFPEDPDPKLSEADQAKWLRLSIELRTIEDHRANCASRGIVTEQGEIDDWNINIAGRPRTENELFATYKSRCLRSRETKIREALRKTMKSVGDTRGGAKKTEAKRKRVEIVVEENVEKEDGGHDDGGNDDGGNDDGGNDDGGNDDGGNDDGGNDDEENDELDEDGQPKKKTKLSAVARGKQPTHGPKKPPGGGRGGRGGRRGGGGGGHIPGAGIMNVD